MDWLIYLFGSGIAFFLGVLLVIAGTATLPLARRRWPVSAATVATLVGLVVIVLSAAPLPYWLYGAAIAVTLGSVVAQRLHWGTAHPRRRIALWATPIAGWTIAAALELPYQISPTLPPLGQPPIYLLADSVSAGMGESASETWPFLLAKAHALELHNYSQMGATTGSALRKAKRLPFGNGIVLLEIGGNDLLGSTSAADFATNLDVLLSLVCGPERSVVMFELPLPPLANEYGRIQRRLAADHGVYLLPKRVFASVLTAPGATVDSVHLTRTGHERMAAAVWDLLRPAYGE